MKLEYDRYRLTFIKISVQITETLSSVCPPSFYKIIMYRDYNEISFTTSDYVNSMTIVTYFYIQSPLFLYSYKIELFPSMVSEIKLLLIEIKLISKPGGRFCTI